MADGLAWYGFSCALFMAVMIPWERVGILGSDNLDEYILIHKYLVCKIVRLGVFCYAFPSSHKVVEKSTASANIRVRNDDNNRCDVRMAGTDEPLAALAIKFDGTPREGGKRNS